VFSHHDVQLIRYAVCDVVARRRLHRNPMPPGMDALEQRLRQPMMSANGHDLGGAPAELKQNTLIGAVEAATLLGCSARHVRRIASDLEGQRVEGQWVFRRQDVAAYADAKGAGHDRN
jgi:hypothetical protein